MERLGRRIAELDDVQAQHHAEGRCVACGNELSHYLKAKGNLRCVPCQRRFRDEEIALQVEQDTARRAAAEKTMRTYSEKAKICRDCHWSNVHDGHIFCLSAYGTCMRKDFREMWKEARQKRESAEAVKETGEREDTE